MKNLAAQWVDTLLRTGNTDAGGAGMAQVLWCFWIYSFFGWALERFFAALTGAEEQRRRCLLVLPLCPVYGLGMLAVLAVPVQGWALPVWGGAAATAVEYAFHWAGEALFGVRFWDYGGVFGNVRGRVCLPFSAAWGMLTACAVRWVQPWVELIAAGHRLGLRMRGCWCLRRIWFVRCGFCGLRGV